MRRSLRSILLAGAAALSLSSQGALAQDLPTIGAQPVAAADEQLLLEADRLIYDGRNRTVTAEGGVQIYYGPYTLEADRIVYDRRSERVVAEGGVVIRQPDGTVLTAERADITDTLTDGFVEALNLRTADNARFAADEAERIDGETTVFTKGVYTACQECRDDPSKPPTWAIKAERIIYDQKREFVYYRDARLEFFGKPIAYLPVFLHGDPTVTRRSGFLIPRVTYTEDLGVGLTVPYYFNLAPNYDVTLRPTLYSRQGLLADGEFRHRLMNGAYSIRAAGILERDSQAFRADLQTAPGTLGGDQEGRGAIETHGRFALSDQWSFGWDGWLVSDRTFLRNYGLAPATQTELTNEIFLTGLGRRNHFDARAQHFTTLTTDIDQEKLPTLHPLIDYHNIPDAPVFGGELRFDANLTSLTRRDLDVNCVNPGTLPDEACGGGVANLIGLRGHATRLSGEASWRRTIVTDFGLAVTPFAALRADGFWTDVEDNPFLPSDFRTEPTYYGRLTPTAGVEYRMPFISAQAWGTQVIEPVVQIVARTDESEIGTLPNEDAQSLVFDTTTLFRRDKFSGWDRVEGGVRANVGLSYAFEGATGWHASAMLGQSFHLAGRNSFAKGDVVNIGVASGLESDVSDIVGEATIGKSGQFELSSKFRLDEVDLAVERLELNATARNDRASIELGYVALAARDALGITDDRRELTAAARMALGDHWSVRGGARYDIDDEYLVNTSLGLNWADDCFDVGFGYSGTYYDDNGASPDHKLSLNISLRTIGGGGITQTVSAGGSSGDDAADAALFEAIGATSSETRGF